MSVYLRCKYPCNETSVVLPELPPTGLSGWDLAKPENEDIFTWQTFIDRHAYHDIELIGASLEVESDFSAWKIHGLCGGDRDEE